MSPPSLLSLIFLTILISLSNTCSSLSTVAISHTTNFTLICALIPSNGDSYLNCSTFPSTAQSPISSNASFSAIIGGNGFLCGLRQQSPSNDSISCWRFSENGTVLNRRKNGTPMTTDKRIYLGKPLYELQSGNSSFCAVFSETRDVRCWQWPGLELPGDRNVSSISVGGDFVCRLSEGGKIDCVPGSTMHAPGGNFSVLAAGSRHACGIRGNGSLECWGETTGVAPSYELEALALGEGRSCGIRGNGTAVCWGKGNFQLPENLTNTSFIEIQAKGSVFCGISDSDYSLICWGSADFEPARHVFDRVMPGPCRRQTCPCGPLSGYGNFCAAGETICERCGLRPAMPPAPTQGTPPAVPPGPTERPSPSGGGGGGGNKANVAFLVVGSVGCFIGLAAAVCFLLHRHCKTQAHSRVHDSGNLDVEAMSHPAPAPSARRLAQVESMRPHLDKRLTAMLSSGTSGNLEEFPLDVLLRVTDNFSDDHRIGYGSFGSVYRATLDDGREVAIKRAESSASSPYAGGIGTKRQEERELAFLSELGLLSRLNHRNLVKLIGYSDDANERVLVYEFVANGSLHEHLHKLDSSPLMAWVTRLKVALDAARGVEYLHTYAVPQIIHRDIKSSNILLDDSWTAKVSDFGLSLLGPGPDEETSHLSLRAAGTVGYMDPEYYRLQQLTAKSDVYSFGVVLLELLTGYKAIHRVEPDGPPTNVVDFAVPYIVSDDIHHILDRRLPPPTPQEIEAVMYAGYLAADCVNLQGRDRPTMSEIVNSLERALAACLVSPPMSRSTTGSST